jgi:teichuronic acid biosynthesis glycosyltransferase TuaC
MSRHRILAVTSEFPNPWQPNRASFNRQHLNALSEFHDVSVFCPVAWRNLPLPPPRLVNRLPPDSVATRLSVTYDSYWYTPGVLRANYDSFMWRSCSKRLLQECDRFRPDVVLGIWGFPDGAVALRLASRIGVPCVLQLMGSDVNLAPTYPRRERKLAAVLRAADRVLPVSNALKEAILTYGVKRSKLSVVYRGVNTELFTPSPMSVAREKLGLSPNKTIIIYVGNLLPVKDPVTLLRAFMKLQRPAEHELHFLGDGPLKRRISELVRDNGIEKSVVLHGVIPHHDLASWFNAADVLALPSRAEGVPNVLLEARACGCPYVATRVGGVPEVSGHDGAVLVEPGDVEGFVDALSKMPFRVETSRAPVPWCSWAEAGRKLGDEISKVLV